MNEERTECGLFCCFNDNGRCAYKDANHSVKKNDFGIEYEECDSLVPFFAE